MRPLRPVSKKNLKKVFLASLLQFKAQLVLNFAFLAIISM